MTVRLYESNPYLKCGEAEAVALGPSGGVILDRTIFFPAGGGQPGDTGMLTWDAGSAAVIDARNCGAGDIELVLAEGEKCPAVGTAVQQRLDWERRLGHMRTHTALHLLSVVLPYPVTGGAISAEKGRLDFNMPEAVSDKEKLQRKLNELVKRDLPVRQTWITDEELADNPGLVKTMSVRPPAGTGKVRLIRIGEGEDQVDLQPCGGTHVERTSEIGPLVIGKVQNKGRLNRRVNIEFAH